jgi:hypothetical protein
VIPLLFDALSCTRGGSHAREALSSRSIESRSAHGGLICVPTALAVDPRAEVPEVPHLSIEEWFALPPEEQAPPVAAAMYAVCGSDVIVAILDGREGTLRSVIEGPRKLLGRVAAVLLDSSESSTQRLLVGRPDIDLVSNLKGPSPGPGPRFPDPTDLEYLSALVRIMRLPAVPTGPLPGSAIRGELAELKG